MSNEVDKRIEEEVASRLSNKPKPLQKERYHKQIAKVCVGILLLSLFLSLSLLHLSCLRMYIFRDVTHVALTRPLQLMCGSMCMRQRRGCTKLHMVRTWERLPRCSLRQTTRSKGMLTSKAPWAPPLLSLGDLKGKCMHTFTYLCQESWECSLGVLSPLVKGSIWLWIDLQGDSRCTESRVRSYFKGLT